MVKKETLLDNKMVGSFFYFYDLRRGLTGEINDLIFTIFTREWWFS